MSVCLQHSAFQINRPVLQYEEEEEGDPVQCLGGSTAPEGSGTVSLVPGNLLRCTLPEGLKRRHQASPGRGAYVGLVRVTQPHPRWETERGRVLGDAG